MTCAHGNTGHVWMTCRLVENVQQLPYSMSGFVKEFAELMFDHLLSPSSAASNQVILRLMHNSFTRLMSRLVERLWQFISIECQSWPPVRSVITYQAQTAEMLVTAQADMLVTAQAISAQKTGSQAHCIAFRM